MERLCQVKLRSHEMILENEMINLDVALKVPESMARKHMAIAVDIFGGKLKVAMKDPFNIYALEDLKIIMHMEIEPILASEEAIEAMINEIYASAKTKDIVSEVEKQFQEELQEENDLVMDKEENAPTVQLINNIIDCCALKGASDIHIEPFENDVRIRYRMDGQLYELTRVKRKTLNMITTRIKFLAGLDIAEKRLPQDGRMSRLVKGQQVELRVSILPTIYGEKTVLRFIYSKGKQWDLKDIGFYAEDYEKVEALLRNPHGIILATGPTGSGKSTTLTAILKALNTKNVNIITVEDPVENITEGINQVAVNYKIGLTFASTLRAILRQDPDIIMIGEMRDSETSQMAIRSAITGHLVLSTLHTNDAASAIIRLMDMGTEAYMVGAAVKGVISQRLVRKLCPICRQKHKVTASEALLYKIPQGSEVYEAVGCHACHDTGYKGRMAIHEVMVIDDKLQEMIATGHIHSEDIKAYSMKRGMRTLWENAYFHVMQGNTTLEEMLKMTYEQTR